MKKEYKEFVILLLIVVSVYFLFRKSTYQIIVPNEHNIGTDDDTILLVGAKPVSPLLTESVTYEFLDTMARLKGADSANEILMVDFEGMTTEEVTELLSNTNVDQLISIIKSMSEKPPEKDKFAHEISIDKFRYDVTEEGSGIDCTKCEWNEQKCVYDSNGTMINCNPGVCKRMGNISHPWPDASPWKPHPELETKWGCKGGKVVLDDDRRCIKWDTDVDPIKCVKYDYDYQSYVPK